VEIEMRWPDAVEIEKSYLTEIKMRQPDAVEMLRMRQHRRCFRCGGGNVVEKP
jgi:hypothetical protein